MLSVIPLVTLFFLSLASAKQWMVYPSDRTDRTACLQTHYEIWKLSQAQRLFTVEPYAKRDVTYFWLVEAHITSDFGRIEQGLKRVVGVGCPSSSLETTEQNLTVFISIQPP